MLSTGTPALSYWSIPYTPSQITKIALLISKGMQEPQTRSPRAGAGLSPVLQGQLLSSPASRSPSSPGSKHAHSIHTLTHTGSPWAQAVTWHGSLGGLQRLWLSFPATDQFRDLGPKLWEPGFEEQEGTATWQFRESCAGWEINTKRLESLAALLPSDGMWREGGRWQALSLIQGWPPTMLASGLAPQAGSSLLMGEGNTASDCTNPRRSIRLGGRGPQSTAQQLVTILLWL